jgi:hypothetical protein
VVPWGRSLDEYTKMFALTPEDLRVRTLDCGAGPASFNAEATEAGHQVISCDPLYRLSADAIRHRVEQTADTLLASVREHADRSVWRPIESPERLREMRLSAMHRFLEDLEVRVFPLLGAYGAPSPHLNPLLRALQDREYAVETRRVPYEFLRDGNEVLSVSGP